MTLRLAAYLLLLSALLPARTRTERVILLTADGLRWQELFTGIDPLLMKEKAAHMHEAEALRVRLWRDSPGERRTALMPFFWRTFAPAGVVLGNAAKGGSVSVTNRYRVSYPGYSEILTGRSQDDKIRGNDKLQNPAVTLLEHVQQKLKLKREEVALFGSWDTFQFIGESRSGAITLNAGYTASDASPRMRELSALQFSMRSPWDSVRHDYITLEMALDHMRRHKPKLIHIALGEMDDWAHDRRYDRTLTSIEYFDAALRQLQEFVDRTPEYRGRTSIVISVDHGRGGTLEDWHGHGPKVAGAERIWIAAAGPDTPAAGEVPGIALQRDIAPTILHLLGLTPADYTGAVGQPIAAITGSK